MGASVKLAAGSFNNPVATIALPDRTGLSHEFIFGQDLAHSAVNLVTGTAVLTQVGTPTYNANSVIISAGGGADNGFTGIIVPNDNLTMVQIRKPPIAGNGANVFYGAAGVLGMLSYAGHFGPDFFNNQGAVAPAVAAHGGHPVTTNYYMHGGRGAPNAFGDAFVGFGGTVSKVTGTGLGSAAVRAGGSMNIGAYNQFNSGSHELCYAAMWGRLLSDAEITTVYNALKAFFNDFVGGTIKVG